jgi:hypothetical protein
MEYEKQVDEILASIKRELLRGIKNHGLHHSTHEGYAVLKEEVDEMWDDIKKDLESHSCVECIQVGAMAVKYILSVQKILDKKQRRVL